MRKSSFRFPRLDAGAALPILGALLCLALPAQAQFLGDRMRIKTENGEKIIGQMQGYDDQALTLLADSAEQIVAYADMARLHRSLGIRSYSKKGARKGLAVGVIIGLLPLLSDGLDSGGEYLAFAALTSLSGSMIGLPIGGLFKGEQWERLNISAYALPVGDRMRIKTENGERIIGRMQGYDDQTLTLLADSAEQIVAYADMLSLERSQGVWRYPVHGAWAGLGVGVLASVALLASAEEGALEGWGGLAYVYATMIATAGGAALGLIFGALMRTEKWERLDIPGQGNGLSVTPTFGVHPTGRLALGARISF